MSVMKKTPWMSGLLLACCCTAAQADYTLSVTGRLGGEGGELGHTRTPPVSNLIQTDDAGTGDGTLWLRYLTTRGQVFQAQGGVLPLACLREGEVVQDTVCRHGVKISLPPGVMAVAPAGGGETLLSFSVLPAGQGAVPSATGSAAGQPVWQGSAGYRLQAGPVPLAPVRNAAVSGQVTAWAGPDLAPGLYTGTVALAGYADGERLLGRETVRYSVTVLPSLPVCTVSVPAAVDFGQIRAGDQDTLLARAGTRISGSCTVSDPADAGKGLYLTFSPGTHGVYQGDTHRLGTSAAGIYITGGTPASEPGCEASLMQFDGQVHPEFQTGTAQNGVNAVEQELRFALCHAPGTALTEGHLTADAAVDVVVQ